MQLSPVQEGSEDCRTGSRGYSRSDSEVSRRLPSCGDASSMGALIVEGDTPIVASTILTNAKVSAAIVDIRALAAGGSGESPLTFLARAAKSAESVGEGSRERTPRHSPRSDGGESPWPVGQEEESPWPAAAAADDAPRPGRREDDGEARRRERLAEEKAELRKLQEA